MGGRRSIPWCCGVDQDLEDNVVLDLIHACRRPEDDEFTHSRWTVPTGVETRLRRNRMLLDWDAPEVWIRGVFLRVGPTIPVPLCLPENNRIWFFANQLFLAGSLCSGSDFEKQQLRIKLFVYEQDQELRQLRAMVANYEAAANLAATPRRRPIPEDVKLVVWARDGGACVRCGHREQLQFDHVIPVAKGGADSAENLQVLCQPCNLRKADAIAC